MKRFVMAVLVAVCVLTGCSRTVEGTLSPTIEPVSAEGMTCADFVVLNERDQAEVVDQILEEGTQSYRRSIAGGLARVLCQTAPQAELEPLILSLAGS